MKTSKLISKVSEQKMEDDQRSVKTLAGEDQIDFMDIENLTTRERK